MTFVDTHPLRDAFIANFLDRLVGQIVEQGEDLLADVGLVFPSRAASSVLLIGERKFISAADIGKALGQPHQLVTQRIDLLIKLGVVQRMDDPNDGRRKLLKLSPMGLDQLERLQRRLTETARVFADLFKEIDCDLWAVATQTMSALAQRSLVERANDLTATSEE